jgi:superfamily II DNA or RNA helicase
MTLRSWQVDFHDAIAKAQHGLNAAIVTGAGKTYGMLTAYESILMSRYSNPLLIITVPKSNIGEGWLKTAREHTNIRLSPSLDPKQFDSTKHAGIVTTYQGLLAKRNELKLLGSKFELIVVRDEAQWLGENDWGDVFEETTKNAVFQVALTGTPFRSVENDNLWGFTYQGGQAVADFTYGYTEALRDGIVPEIRWATLGGLIAWERQLKNGKVKAEASRFGEDEGRDTNGFYVSETLINRRLRHATWASRGLVSPYLLELLQEACDALVEIRKTHSNAGGIAFAQNIAGAEKVAEVLRRNGQGALVVHGQQSDAQDRIDAFRAGNTEWLVSVDLIKEGTDLPRLRVAVLGSNVTTPRQVLQMCGRLLRRDTWLGHQPCQVIAPADPRITEILENFGKNVPLKKPEKGRSKASPLTGPVFNIPLRIDANDVALELEGTLGTSSHAIQARAKRFEQPFLAAGFTEQFGDLRLSSLLALEDLWEVATQYRFTSLINHIKAREDLALDLAANTGLDLMASNRLVDLLLRAASAETAARCGNLQVGQSTALGPAILPPRAA